MGNSFFDIGYEVLSQYLHFPDVADTYKSITEGKHYQNNFPWEMDSFLRERSNIISYIVKVRINNVIDTYQERENPFLLMPVPSGKSLFQAPPKELYDNLSAEIPRLILKGIHQTIKHLNVIWDDNGLTAELLQQDTTVLRKYGLQVTEERKYGQT